MLLALPVFLALRPDAIPRPWPRMSSLPAVTLWVWERAEDMRGMDTRRFAIAYLDQTLTIGLSVQRQARREPIVFPDHATRIAVVRIETSRFPVLDDMAREETVAAILDSAREPGIGALQIDFDATRSQRAFYRGVIEETRRRMPPDLPLSMTALASWCSWDDWLQGLPVDEAVPMYFRMEPDRRRAAPDVDAFALREPLCRTSVGVSTTEPWPVVRRGERVYVFPEKGWRQDGQGEAFVSLQRRLP